MALDSSISLDAAGRSRVVPRKRARRRPVVRIRDLEELRARQRECFVEMPLLGLGTPAQTSVYTPAYDAVLALHGRPDVREIGFGDDLGDEDERIAVLLPYFAHSSRARQSRELLGVAEHGTLQDVCAMIVDDAADLERHLGIIYQVSRLNYLDNKSRVLGFPGGCCMHSSAAVADGLQLLGYVNAFRAVTQLRTLDHHYVSLPFVMRSGEWGLIGLDPTSDQLKSFGVQLPPNLLFVAVSDDLKYSISTRSDNGFFPHSLYFRTVRGTDVYSQRCRGVDYLVDAFLNPVELKLSIDK